MGNVAVFLFKALIFKFSNAFILHRRRWPREAVDFQDWSFSLASLAPARTSLFSGQQTRALLTVSAIAFSPSFFLHSFLPSLSPFPFLFFTGCCFWIVVGALLEPGKLRSLTVGFLLYSGLVGVPHPKERDRERSTWSTSNLKTYTHTVSIQTRGRKRELCFSRDRLLGRAESRLHIFLTSTRIFLVLYPEQPVKTPASLALLVSHQVDGMFRVHQQCHPS